MGFRQEMCGRSLDLGVEPGKVPFGVLNLAVWSELFPRCFWSGDHGTGESSD